MLILNFTILTGTTDIYFSDKKILFIREVARRTDANVGRKFCQMWEQTNKKERTFRTLATFRLVVHTCRTGTWRVIAFDASSLEDFADVRQLNND